jgi:hypothetical protein
VLGDERDRFFDRSDDAGAGSFLLEVRDCFELELTDLALLGLDLNLKVEPADAA